MRAVKDDASAYVVSGGGRPSPSGWRCSAARAPTATCPSRRALAAAIPQRRSDCPWLLVAVLVAAGCRRPAPPAPELLYTLDVSRPGSGVAVLELRLRGFPAGELTLRRGANGAPRTTVVENVQARAGARPLKLVPRAGEETWTVPVAGVADEITVSWRARQGGLGRHGHEGYLGSQFGLVDGNAFLVPALELERELAGWRGESRVRRVRVRVLAPAGWKTASTMSGAADALDPAIDGRFPLAHLANANIAVGPLVLTERRIGAVRVRVVAFAGWPEAKRTRAALAVFRIYGVFDRETPCRGLPAYTVLLLPLADDGRAVAGKFWAAGQAFSPDVYGRSRRGYELIAHRIAHTVNREPLCGLNIAARDERWFVEGWASWVEVTHGIAAGVIADEQRLVELGSAYRAVALGLDPAVRDLPLIRESSSAGENPQTLYLHYTKAPVVVAALDHQLRRLSGGTKTINGFAAALHARFGGRPDAVPLRAELAAYAGVNVDAFFSRYVHRSGVIYPLHAEFLAQLRRPATATKPPQVALRVDGRELTVEHYERLLRLYGRLGLTPAAAREELVGMQLVLEEYLRRQLSVVPPEVVELVDRLPASVRVLLYRQQTELLFGDAARRDAWLAARRPAARVELLVAPAAARAPAAGAVTDAAAAPVAAPDPG